MKNKVFTIVILAIIIIFAVQLNVHAVIVSTDKQVESGSGTITISVTSNQALGAYTLRLTDAAGLTLVNAAGGEVSSDKKTITGSSAYGTKSLGKYTFNVPTVDKDTTYNIKFSITGMETPSLEAVEDETNTAVLTVKAKQVTPTPEPEPKPEPEPQPQPEPTPEPKPENPTTKELEFTSIDNKTVYLEKSTNFRSEYKINNSNIIAKLAVGTEVIQIGISKTQSEGHTWSKIIYNGKTGYLINENLTLNKPEEPTQEKPTQEPQDEEPKVTTDESKNDETSEIIEGLKNLEIEGLTLTPTFSSNVYEYRVIVKEDLSELKINAVAAIENATITIAGNQNLQEGENLITIIVYNAKKEVEATYQITANKSTLDLSSTDRMLQIGTKEATRNLIIFIVAFVIAIIVLIVVLVLKHRNNYEYYDEDEEEFTDFKENVENIQNNIAQDEYQETKREKRKGKHF